MVYNFDDARFYYDSWYRESAVNNVARIKIRISPQEINIRDLPPGDFSIVIDTQGCKRRIIGRGYSGFPDSAIRIE